MLFSAEKITLGTGGRVIVTNDNRNFSVCPSYGLIIHTHNDTLATLLCKVLGMGDSGIAEDVPLLPELAMVKALDITHDLNVTVDDEVNDNCAELNRSLAVKCYSKYF